MKNKKILFPVIFAIASVFFIARFFQPSIKEVYVSHVVDGDTIEFSNGEKVRYLGIDTPEVREHDDLRGWIYNPAPYAEEAKNFNQKLVEGKRVRLEFDVQKRDKYNRLLAYVYPIEEEGEMINLQMIREGYAMIYTYPPNVKYLEAFMKAQIEARENKKGLWRDLEEGVISTQEAGEYLGQIKLVEAKVLSTYLSEKVLILNCADNFKAVIFANNLRFFPKEVSRSPDSYFKYKTIRVYGVIKEYKSSYEIILNTPSQLEILE